MAPYVVTPGGTYDFIAFSCYYTQQQDGAGPWAVFAAQLDFSYPVTLGSGYPDQASAQAALEQMLTTDSLVRRLNPPVQGSMAGSNAPAGK